MSVRLCVCFLHVSICVPPPSTASAEPQEQSPLTPVPPISIEIEPLASLGARNDIPFEPEGEGGEILPCETAHPEVSSDDEWFSVQSSVQTETRASAATDQPEVNGDVTESSHAASAATDQPEVNGDVTESSHATSATTGQPEVNGYVTERPHAVRDQSGEDSEGQIVLKQKSEDPQPR